MKNKKLFLISAFLILAFAGGIFFATGKIEEKWEVKEKGTNNLSANGENITAGETAFDYPYTVLTPEILLDNGWDEETVEMRFEHVETQEGKNGRMSYQKAVNIAGELIKDIYGDTSPQTIPLYIQMAKNEYARWMNKEDEHLSMVVSTNVGQLGKGNQYTIMLNALSGEVEKIEYYYGGPHPLPEGRTMEDFVLTEQQAKDIFLNEIGTLLKLFGENSAITGFWLSPIYEKNLDQGHHIIVVRCENNKNYEFMYNKLDQTLNEFSPVTDAVFEAYGIDW